LNKFLERISQITGMESSLLVSTCTAANLTALLVHTEPGDQVILEEESHILWQEEWALTAIAGVFPKSIKGKDGIMDADKISQVTDHTVSGQSPNNSVICIENTHNTGGGTVYSVKKMKEISKVAKKRNMKLHIDGARIFDAAVSEDTEVINLTSEADSISISLNKTLGIPFGSVLCGTQEFIEKAKKESNKIGAFSLHKGGLIAAAGLEALDDDNFKETYRYIKKTHDLARYFAKLVSQIPKIEIDTTKIESNIVLIDVSKSGMNSYVFIKELEKRGVVASLRSKYLVRFVFSRDISKSDITNISSVIQDISKHYNCAK